MSAALHVLPDLADPATHGLMATRMSLDAATSDLRKFKASAERELQRQASELKRKFETAADASRGADPRRSHDAVDRTLRSRGGRRPASRASWSASSAASSTSR